MAAVMEARVEHIRTAVDVCAWTSIGLGLAFTTVNVQAFGAGDTAVFSLVWWVAWLLDPIPSLLLIAILLTEQITARWQVQLGGWIGVTKWTTFAATAGMNTWSAVAAGSGADIFKHAVPPVMVLLGAQVAPLLRDGLTEAVAVAAASALEAVPPEAPATAPPTMTSGATTHPDGAEAAAPVLSTSSTARTSATRPDVGDGSGAGEDWRVTELARRLVAGENLDGAAAAAVVGGSERNARRFLTSARSIVETQAAGDRADAETAAGPQRPALSVIGGS